MSDWRFPESGSGYFCQRIDQSLAPGSVVVVLNKAKRLTSYAIPLVETSVEPYLLSRYLPAILDIVVYLSYLGAKTCLQVANWFQ